MDVTAYAVTRAVDLPFEEIVERVTAALATEGFGVAANPALEPLAAVADERIEWAMASL